MKAFFVALTMVCLSLSAFAQTAPQCQDQAKYVFVDAEHSAFIGFNHQLSNDDKVAGVTAFEVYKYDNHEGDSLCIRYRIKDPSAVNCGFPTTMGPCDLQLVDREGNKTPAFETDSN